jgi:hypothetical protein
MKEKSPDRPWKKIDKAQLDAGGKPRSKRQAEEARLFADQGTAGGRQKNASDPLLSAPVSI